MRWPILSFEDAVEARGSGSRSLAQSEWRQSGAYPVIGQGAEPIEGRTDRKDLLITPSPAVVLYGGHTRRAKYVDVPFVPGPNVRILEPSGAVDAKYLYWFLAQLPIESRGYADHFPQVRRCGIPIPPLPEQKRIAAILDAADALRAKRRRSIEQLDSLIYATFLNMFGDPVTNVKGWRVSAVGDVVTRLTNGYVGPTRGIYVDQGVPYLLARHVHHNHLKFDGKTHVSLAFNHKHRKSMLKAGDVLLVQSGHIGESAVVPACHEGHNCHAMIVITPMPAQLTGQYLSHLFQAFCAKGYWARIKTGISVPHLNCRDVRKVLIPLPPLDLQTRFATIVDCVERQQAQMKAHLSELDALFTSFQSSAFDRERSA